MKGWSPICDSNVAKSDNLGWELLWFIPIFGLIGFDKARKISLDLNMPFSSCISDWSSLLNVSNELSTWPPFNFVDAFSKKFKEELLFAIDSVGIEFHERLFSPKIHVRWVVNWGRIKGRDVICKSANGSEGSISIFSRFIDAVVDRTPVLSWKNSNQILALFSSLISLFTFVMLNAKHSMDNSSIWSLKMSFMGGIRLPFCLWS